MSADGARRAADAARDAIAREVLADLDERPQRGRDFFRLGFAAGVWAALCGTMDYRAPASCADIAWADWTNVGCGEWSVAEPPDAEAVRDGSRR